MTALNESNTFHGLAHPKLTWGLAFDHQRLLVTLGRVAKPLVSYMTPISHNSVNAGKDIYKNVLYNIVQCAVFNMC